MTHRLVPIALFATLLLSCGGEDKTWECELGGQESPEFAQELGCDSDFLALASEPLDASIPGARSAKTVIDRMDENALYFQNSTLYPTHWDFASTHLSGDGLPIVPMRSEFSSTEYSSPSRRFLLGAITYYEATDKYTYEIAPYDTATPDLIADAYEEIAAATFIGDNLYFHPTSEAIERVIPDLPESVKVITTDELFEGVEYQALNVAESYGQLRFITREELETDFVGFRDIAVLDEVPNDISVVMGIITSEFQTPLSHVNVLSQNRGTPNMALRDAYNRSDLRALEGEWVHFVVGPFDYTIEEATQEEADAWWDAHKPSQVQIPGMDLTATALRDIDDVLDLSSLDLHDAIKAATRAFGGKASHYSALRRIEGVPVRPGFAIPVYFYDQFMKQNGFDTQVEAMLADADFENDPAVRKQRLLDLQAAIMAADVDPDFEQALIDKLNTEYSGLRMRFRSSTNAEDLDGFTGAGLYTSKSGDPSDPAYPVMDAVREVWASIWNYRAFEERTYRSIDHLAVGMAILVHQSFPEEEANGVALTNNPFDKSGYESAFYVNVQIGDVSVVQPDPTLGPDQIIYYYDRPGRPIVYVAHSSLLMSGDTVLTDDQIYQLGQALDAIRAYFAPAYGSSTEWWAMDTEFKFDDDGATEEKLYVKQTRPYSGS